MAFQSAARNMGLEMDQRTDCNRKNHRSQPYIQHGQPREQICAKMEQKYVHDVYNKTAHHFADVRYKAWPKVKEFLMNQDPGSIVADVGELKLRSEQNFPCFHFLFLNFYVLFPFFVLFKAHSKIYVHL